MADVTMSVATLDRVLALLGDFGEHVARVPLAGDLNEEQTERLLFALRALNGLEALFQAERLRATGAPAPLVRES